MSKTTEFLITRLSDNSFYMQFDVVKADPVLYLKNTDPFTEVFFAQEVIDTSKQLNYDKIGYFRSQAAAYRAVIQRAKAKNRSNVKVTLMEQVSGQVKKSTLYEGKP